MYIALLRTLILTTWLFPPNIDLKQKQKPGGLVGSFLLFQGQKETMTQEAKWDEALLTDLLGTRHQLGSRPEAWGLAHSRGAW